VRAALRFAREATGERGASQTHPPSPDAGPGRSRQRASDDQRPGRPLSLDCGIGDSHAKVLTR